MKQQQISILGCGWLGMPLAEFLIQNNFKIKGSTTTQSKISSLRDIEVEAFLIRLDEKECDGFMEAFLSESETLIIAIPPGLRKQPKSNYVAKIAQLIPYVERSAIKQVLFISSTSVYQDNEFFPITTEEREFYAETNVAKQLLEVETLLMQNKHFKTTILRLSGLFDDKRHPARYLSGRTGIKNPKAPVNLVHQSDAVRIIHQLIAQRKWGDIYHAATTPHPGKKNYYTRVCKAMGIAPPNYNNDLDSVGKVVVSTKLMESIGYEFEVTLE